MEYETICHELILIADKEQEEIERTLPIDPIHRFVLFTETIRVSDYMGFSQNVISEDNAASFARQDIISMGWNLAASFLFKSLEVEGFPITESTTTTRLQIASLLYKFGRTTMLRRSVDMIKSGILTVEKHGNTFIFRKEGSADSQFLDAMEFSYLNELEIKITDRSQNNYRGWDLVEKENLFATFNQSGSFLLRDNQIDLSNFILKDIDSLMEPLIGSWDSGHGKMMSYGGSHEIDAHFLAKATKLVLFWREEAGLHNNAKLGGITGEDIVCIVTVLVIFHLKHVHFTQLFAQKFSDISIPQNLTIWTFLDSLINDISMYTGLEINLVSKVFDAIMMKAEDVKHLKHHTSKFMPLAIDIGNGFVLRPVSSLIFNPFFSIIALLEFRNPNLRNEISAPREEWFRTQLYSLFQGVRYQRVEGNIKIREGSFTATDIDAAIYDNLTGELALFQIKWQDFFSNDVKKLRSKASNLTKELDDWAEKTKTWINVHGYSELYRSLRLKTAKRKSISSIYLFGICRNKARVEGYGFTIKTDSLAIANWPQFIRNRFNIGPDERVIHKLFESLKAESKDKISPKPLPHSFTISDIIVNYEDLWVTI
jgi:hypothetical protein